MVINVHAGHNADGKRACGAVGLIKESTEARNVKNLVISKLQTLGHTVYDCTVDDALSQGLNLYGIVKKCNAHTVDLDVSIHFNSGANDKTGNGKSTGVEVLCYDNSSNSPVTTAKKICDAIAELGYKNRGVKYNKELYVLAKTKAPALLVECCFVDDKDDVAMYTSDSMATAIVKGITGNTISSTNIKINSTSEKTVISESSVPFIVKVLVSDLNIRKGAGTSYAVVGKCKKGTKYTIIKINNGWGYLKSGAGWIYLSTQYVEKA